MVAWSDQERSIITSIFSNLDYNDVGPKALTRCLIVYPWTQRYFAGFGNLYNADAIRTNPNIQTHGTKILHGLDRAVKNMDDIKATYAELSVLHSEKLHVDPDNFKVGPAAPRTPSVRDPALRRLPAHPACGTRRSGGSPHTHRAGSR
ncbi:hemoglobin subunit beta-like [Poecilia reticulata]|uniref:Hemoglobin beta embryonic-2 n=1 Tax=Poecilia reticulata TaxID=8081 RepID=A0A3P9PR64_POERE|nr:PREDICTED: hemoglobin subunit beta-like [Poecilia reticulata]